MGNKLGRRRQVVDEKYTRPQGLYNIKDVDMKKLRKLILESKLAPCYPGEEDCSCEFEECPICFLYYPSLNRSKCCMKGICTECFLQMKTPNSTLPTQCPFCKTSNYAVEYRGSKTKEEKGMEQVEEQRVIEAKIRMRQQELQDDEERMHKRQEISSSVPLEVEYSSVAGNVPSSSSPVEVEEIVSSQELCAAPVIRRPPHPRTNRDDEFDLDLEDIMVMEAIWLSIQENEGQRNHAAYVESAPSEQYVTEDCYVSQAMVPPSTMSSSSSPSGGLACAIAALAERQQIGGESSISHDESTVASAMHPSSRFFNRVGEDVEHYSPAQSSTEDSPERMVVRRGDGEWNVEHGSEMGEAGTSYASSEVTEDGIGMSGLLPPPDPTSGGFETVSGPVVPESFEEQMMLAMAVSLAEARAVTTRQGVAWQ